MAEITEGGASAPPSPLESEFEAILVELLRSGTLTIETERNKYRIERKSSGRFWLYYMNQGSWERRIWNEGFTGDPAPLIAGILAEDSHRPRFMGHTSVTALSEMCCGTGIYTTRSASR